MDAAIMEDEQGFKEMWIEVQTRFAQITKKSLVQSQNRSLDDVLKELDRRFNEDDRDDGRKQKRVKELATNVLTLVQLLGGIAAQGASMVFGPASLCFNAVQFLIEIPAKVSKFYDELALLFEEISEYMKQFRIYKRIEQFAKVDIELKQSTHKLMILFVDICAISIDVLSSSRLKRAKIVVGIALFDDDTGIHDKLEEFRRVIDHQSRISDAITLEQVLKTEHSLMEKVFEMLNTASEESRKKLEVKSQEIQDELRDAHGDLRQVKAGQAVLTKDVYERTSERKLSEQTNHICRKLDVSLDEALSPEKDFDWIRSNSVQGIGAWLDGNDVYKQWTDFESGFNALLMLSGSSGTGKSNLAAAIRDKLTAQSRKPDSSSTRVSLGCYGFGKIEKSSRDGASKYPRQSLLALKYMAVQMAKQNFLYARNLSSHLESKDLSFSQDLNVKDLAKELFPPPNTKDTTLYVLLFDGLDQISSDEATQLVDTVLSLDSSKTRIAMTGAEEVFYESLEYLGKTQNLAKRIRVQDYNESDITLYIEFELKLHKALQDDGAGISRIVDSIRKQLPKIANGNFDNARQIIERAKGAVESDQSEEEVQSLISADTLENKDSLIRRIINELNNSLNAQEIEQLNELLIWAIYGNEYMSLDEMRATFFLRMNRAPLQNLEDKVKEKYSKLLDVRPDNDDDPILYIKNSDVEDFFRKSGRDDQPANSEANDDPKISMNITINNVDASKVQRFFWDLSEKMVFDKFPFTDSSPDLVQKARISANKAEANLTLTRRCFDLLFDEPNEETKILGRYATRQLTVHLGLLRESVGEGVIELTEREEVLGNLIGLLQSPNCIDRHLNWEFFEDKSWLGGRNQFEAITAWLHDSEATARLNRRDLIWLKQVNSGNKWLALKNVATTIVHHWLRRNEYQAVLPFQWIDAFLEQMLPVQESAPMTGEELQQIEDRDSPVMNEVESGDIANHNGIKKELSLQARVSRAVEWAEKEAKITEKTSLWYERLGCTYLGLGELELSIHLFHKATELPDSNWAPYIYLAEALAKSNDKATAIQKMEIAFSELRGTESLSAIEKSCFVQNLLLTARWLVALENPHEAIEKLKEAISIDPLNSESHHGLLKLFIETEQVSEARNLLDNLRTRPAKNNDLTQLEAVLFEISSWDEPLFYFETIFQATKESDISEVILQSLQGALTFSKDSGRTSKMIGLLLGHGVALAHYSADETRLELALTRWEECCKLGFQPPHLKKWETTFSAAKYIFNYHFSKARSVAISADEFASHANKLGEVRDRAYIVPRAAQELNLSLGGLYSLSGKQDSARYLLLNEIKYALDVLSDDDLQNDHYGFRALFDALVHTGDDLNALSAWSLRGPPERYSEIDSILKEATKNVAAVRPIAPQNERVVAMVGNGYVSLMCNGGCNVDWTYADSVWHCKFCHDVDFDDACLAKVKNGTLPRLECGPDHEWLRLPSLLEEFRETGKNRVRVGGELVDGRRVGGRIVPVEEWLDMIREEWGIEKPTARNEVPPEPEKAEE